MRKIAIYYKNRMSKVHKQVYGCKHKKHMQTFIPASIRKDKSEETVYSKLMHTALNKKIAKYPTNPIRRA